MHSFSVHIVTQQIFDQLHINFSQNIEKDEEEQETVSKSQP